MKEITAIWELYGDELHGCYKCDNCDTYQLKPTEICPNCKAKMIDCMTVEEAIKQSEFKNLLIPSKHL